MAAVLVKCTTILAWEGVWECSVEERMDVRQRSRGVGVFCGGKVRVQILLPSILCYKYAIMWLLC